MLVKNMCALFRILLIVSTFLASQAAVAQAIIPRAPDIAATSYILIDAKTGHVIVEENADEPLPPASLTKIMTAYIAVEEIVNGNLALDDMVHVSEKAWRHACCTDGSKMWIEVGTDVRVEDLLRGIIISSGNDASVAIAEHVAGSEDAFTDMMNQYAEVMGMEQSFFMNSHGYDTEEYYNTMSARDLTIIARATIEDHHDFYPLYSEREFTYNNIRQTNYNKLLFRDRNVDGMKTGSTDVAGWCLVASAERDGMRLISVVMGAANDEARMVESQKLLTYGFRYFETHKLYDANQVLASVPVYAGETDAVDLGTEEEVYITIPRGQAEAMTAAVDVDQLIEAPIADRQNMGVVNVMLDDELLFSGDVVAMHPVAEGGMIKRFVDWVGLIFSDTQ